MNAPDLLQRLIRFNTVNPPGNEGEALTFLRGLLEGAGWECELPAKVPERPNLVARLRGAGPGPTLALISHVDTVPQLLPLAGLNQSELRPPTFSRHQPPSAIFILLAATWLLVGIRIRTPALIAAAVGSVLAIGSDLKMMNHDAKTRSQPTSASVLNSPEAIDIAGASARPYYDLPLGLKAPVPVDDYLRAAGDFGWPGTPEIELATDDAGIRAAADSTPGAPGIELTGRLPGRHVVCGKLRTGGPAVRVGRRPGVINRGSEGLGAALTKFSDPPGIEVGAVLPKGTAGVDPPPDESRRPWRLAITRGGAAEVCG